jgi:hypothetical protein
MVSVIGLHSVTCRTTSKNDLELHISDAELIVEITSLNIHENEDELIACAMTRDSSCMLHMLDSR